MSEAEVRRVIEDHFQGIAGTLWKVDIDAMGATGSVELSHPLTQAHGVGLYGMESTEDLRDFLLHNDQLMREYQVVNDAPLDAHRNRLLGEVRRTAFACRWTHAVLTEVAMLLASEDLIRRDDATWIEEAGVPWGGF